MKKRDLSLPILIFIKLILACLYVCKFVRPNVKCCTCCTSCYSSEANTFIATCVFDGGAQFFFLMTLLSHNHILCHVNVFVF